MICPHCGHELDDKPELEDLSEDLDIGNEVLDELIGRMDESAAPEIPPKEGKVSIEVLKIKPKKRDE